MSVCKRLFVVDPRDAPPRGFRTFLCYKKKFYQWVVRTTGVCRARERERERKTVVGQT